jgi:Fe-Mn family superoxide dismutase
LEPHIDTRTMAIHYAKHHQAYVDNLNQALEAYEDLQGKSTIALLLELEALPEEIRTAVRNNGGGHFNHSMFWRCMSPEGGGQPGGGLAEAIQASFGSFAAFQETFGKAATTLFGNGWVWLSVDAEGGLVVTTTPGHDNPFYEGLFPVLVLDVWEHAYYLKYENRRADYITAWWNVVNWNHVAGNFNTGKLDLGLGKAADWVKATWQTIEASWSKLMDS